MSTQPTTCDPASVELYLDGRLGDAQQLQLERHLETCSACRLRLDHSAADETWWREASRFLPADDWDGPASRGYLDTVSPDGEAVDAGVSESLLKRLNPWLDPSDDPLMLGRFGGYEIAGIIGEGGMGIVLKGRETALNRFVAIKLLAPHLASNGAARQRFSREAQAAAAVLHENVIAIHRVDQAQSLPFLVMPYIGGVSLQKRLDREGALSIPTVLRIARQIAAGLTAAHAQGLVHRDVKPANILLERGVDRVTLTDFGLARTVDDATLTRSGVIAGTPQYMSPEQARGDAIDGRSDLFSLGSVMYAMCTGRPPFRAETPFGVLRRITDDEARSLREINPDVPEWLESIIFRLLAKSMGERYQSAAEVAELLEHCLAHIQQPTRIPLPEIPPLPKRLAASAAATDVVGPKIASIAKTVWISLAAVAALAIAIGLYVLNLPPVDRKGDETSPNKTGGEMAGHQGATNHGLGTQIPGNDAGREKSLQWDDDVGRTLNEIDTTLKRMDSIFDLDLSQEPPK